MAWAIIDCDAGTAPGGMHLNIVQHGSPTSSAMVLRAVEGIAVLPC
jgi:hypothetical protein